MNGLNCEIECIGSIMIAPPNDILLAGQIGQSDHSVIIKMCVFLLVAFVTTASNYFIICRALTHFYSSH